MSDKTKEFKKKAQEVKKNIPSSKVRVRDEDNVEPYKDKPKKEAKEPEVEEEGPKKNQLAEIPKKVDVAYDGSKREEDLDTEEPAQVLAEKVKNGDLSNEDLSVDDRMVMIGYLSEQEQKTGDQIAEVLGVSRRTVVNYLRKLREFRARQLAEKDSWELGGELYEMGMHAMRESLKQGKFQQFSHCLSTLITTLQSLGLLYKMPERSQQQLAVAQSIQFRGSKGFDSLKKQSQGEEHNLEGVLHELFDTFNDDEENK